MNDGPAELACHCRYCEPIPEQEQTFDAGDRKLMADVAEYGWHVVSILDGTRARGWVFSVGMWHTFRSPELAMFGLPQQNEQLLINDIGRRVQAGQRLEPNVQLEDLLTSGLPLALRPIHPSWYDPMFGYATWFARRPPLPFLQVFWPDKVGRFPWDDFFDREYAADQPRLWIPADEHPMGAWSGVLAPIDWPFADPEDTKVFTTKRVTDDGADILNVYHDEDGAWQFIDDGPTEREDAAIVHLSHLVGADPTLASLTDLERGWAAHRPTADQPWSREPFRAE